MKIVTYPHDMSVGGSQLNAIELAAAVQRRGHEVVIFGQQGPLVKKVAELGLEFVHSPTVHRRPTYGVAAGLRRLVAERGMNIVHGYEWPPSLEALLACRGRSHAVAVSTVMSMSVAPFIPTNMPMLLGTKQLATAELEFGRTRVGLMEPPVDTVLNRPGLELGLRKFMSEWGVEPEIFTVSIVSRLAPELKLEGILCAIDTVRFLNQRFPIQLIITGAGPSSAQVHAYADRANLMIGHRRIFMTGELSDPRPAYAVADVALAMGGSALRAMAFERPLIVQGENGYWKLLTPETLPEFLWKGWYGSGSGIDSGTTLLARYLTELASDPERCRLLGIFARTTVCERFSLDSAAEALLEFYETARQAHDTAGNRLRCLALSGWRFGAYSLERSRWGKSPRQANDDFNALPLAAKKSHAVEETEVS